MTLKLAIWDVDGTLVDSREMIQTAMQQAFERCRLVPPRYDQTRHIVGLDLVQACQSLAPPDFRNLPELVTAYKQAFVTLRSAPDFTEILYPGAIETLQTLADDGWLLAVATGKSHQGLRALFAQHPIEAYFDTIWCADDGPGKPHPFMCLEAMAALGAEPTNSLIIGDAVHDMRMGRAAGILSLGVSWGFGEADELTAAGAHQVFDTFSDLRAGLENSVMASK